MQLLLGAWSHLLAFVALMPAAAAWLQKVHSHDATACWIRAMVSGP